jgi:DHA1 family multidrug resistance protein-like MFS transporter
MNSDRKNLAILFFTMVVVMLGFGMVIPIMPFYVKSFGASGKALGALMAVYGLMQFIFAPIWGGLSDRHGRKPILMIGILGNAATMLLFALSSELWMLFAARALAGVLSSATLPTAMAYVSDTTTERQRGGGMGMIGAAMGVGMVLGPGIGGWLAVRSLSTPFFLGSFLSIVALLLVWWLLPEPRRPEEPANTLDQSSRFAMLKQALVGPIGMLLVISFLLTFGLTNFEAVFGLYAADRYSYGTQMVGGVLTFIGVISALAQGLLTGPLTRRFGEVAIIRWALACTSLGFVLLTLPQTMPQVLLATGFFVFSNSMLNPSVASLISKRTPYPQGVSMGLNNSFLSLGRIVGPLWAGFSYDASLNMPYFSGAAIMLVGFFISLLTIHPQENALPEATPAPAGDLP